MRILSNDQINKINKQALADKYGVSRTYVGQILAGQRNPNTEIAQSIINDAKGIVGILEDNPNQPSNV